MITRRDGKNSTMSAEVSGRTYPPIKGSKRLTKDRRNKWIKEAQGKGPSKTLAGALR